MMGSVVIIEYILSTHEPCRIVIQCDIQDFAQDSSEKKAIHRSDLSISSDSHNGGGCSEDGDYDTVQNVWRNLNSLRCSSVCGTQRKLFSSSLMTFFVTSIFITRMSTTYLSHRHQPKNTSNICEYCSSSCKHTGSPLTQRNGCVWPNGSRVSRTFNDRRGNLAVTLAGSGDP